MRFNSAGRFSASGAGSVFKIAAIASLIVSLQFQINFGETPNLVRNYRSFSALTDEIARSRVYGGVHFPFDIAAGQSAGRSVANFVFLNYLTPRRRNLN
ncbi:MAG: hypothetical protein WKF71_18015 [Pyrinomonadaceae bacterium]